MKTPNGYVFYRGPSLITGKPIIAVAIGFAAASENAKTGAMIQTYILPADVPPNEAVRTGQDKDVCGGCIHRPIVAKRTGADPCYVHTGQGPLVVWRGVQRGLYPDVTPEGLGVLVAGRGLRLGSWGEPVAVPLGVWQPALGVCAFHTGYTHRWRTRSAGSWRGVLQASCDSLEDYHDAVAAGWGTFRVALPGEAGSRGPQGLGVSEMQCPAAKEAGKQATCADCRACNGTARVVILSHGPRYRRSLPVAGPAGPAVV